MASVFKKVTLVLGSIYAIFFLFSFKNDKGIVSPATSTKKFYLTTFQDFLQTTKNFQTTLTRFYADEVSQEKVQADFQACRSSYKEIEFLVAYFDPDGIKKNINGAPLPSLEPKVPEVHVIAPSGLQRIDEIVFSPVEEWPKEELLSLSKDLGHKANELYLVQRSHPIFDRHVFEAARSGLIRIFTLGVTGFDTPASDNAIGEAKIGVENIQKVLKPYLPYVSEKNSALANTIRKQFEAVVQWLDQNQDFDGFDRLYFLKEHVNPLYASLLDAQLALGVEMIYETTDRELPVNYMSKNLFDENYLNPYYYTKLTDKIDNTKLTELGRTLFFDPILSHNNKRSCASCHKPTKGFADGVAKSLAFDFKGTVDRNAPTVLNAAYATRFFHDMRSDQLDSQIEHVIFSEKEFHTNYQEITGKLKQSEEYVQLFKEAFSGHKDPIFKSNLASALASYIISLKSFNSPFDQYVRGERKELSADVKRGFNLFMGKAACGTCHFAPVFNGNVPPNYQDTESEVLGVTTNEDFDQPVLDGDKGRYANKRPKDHADYMMHAFKTPTVRNIELTAPYMHNGAYHSLEKVMDFYNEGGGAGLGLDIPNQTLPFDSLALNQQEVNDIIAFMKSLTDTTGVTYIPENLPQFKNQSSWNTRQIGGEY